MSIDDYLEEIRDANTVIEFHDRAIRNSIRMKDQARASVAEKQGRIAFLEGKPKGRNPLHAPLKQYWTAGYAAEMREELETQR